MSRIANRPVTSLLTFSLLSAACAGTGEHSRVPAGDTSGNLVQESRLPVELTDKLRDCSGRDCILIATVSSRASHISDLGLISTSYSATDAQPLYLGETIDSLWNSEGNIEFISEGGSYNQLRMDTVNSINLEPGSTYLLLLNLPEGFTEPIVQPQLHGQVDNGTITFDRIDNTFYEVTVRVSDFIAGLAAAQAHNPY